MDQDIEKKLVALEKRNLEKDTNKAWETSKTRRVLIALFTYFVIGLFMSANGVDKPWVSAIIPTMGFVLSTLSLSFIKDLWIKYIYRPKW